MPGSWQIDFSLDIRWLTATRDLETDDLSTCSTLLGTTGDRRIYVYIQQGSDTLTTQVQEIIIDYDYDPPEPVQNVTASAGESNARVSWDDPDNAAESSVRYRVFYAPFSFTADELDRSGVLQTSTVSTKSTQVTGLTLNTEYTFRVVALDQADNESSASAAATATPVAVNDFFEEYRAQGGSEEGGFCAASDRSPGLSGLLLLLLGLTAWGLRRRGSLASVLVAALLLSSLAWAPAPASAEESPRSWTFNFRVGPYKPEIDSELSAKPGPYESVFQDDSAWMFRWEFGRLITDVPGSIFFTAEAGWGRVKGHGILPGTGERSSDTTKMNFVPLSFGIFWQMDIFARRWNVPLVPYARAGFTYSIWWIKDGVGSTAKITTQSGDTLHGRGGTWGAYFGGGLRLMLDTFASQMARSFDEEMGVNDSYIFFEVLRNQQDDFGSSKSFDLSDTLLLFGLGFDF